MSDGELISRCALGPPCPAAVSEGAFDERVGRYFALRGHSSTPPQGARRDGRSEALQSITDTHRPTVLFADEMD